jgi:hypothetical protein
MGCKCRITCNRILAKVISSTCYRDRTINIRGQRCTGGIPTTVTVMWKYTTRVIKPWHIDRENWVTTDAGDTISPVYNVCEFNHTSGSVVFGIDMSIADYPFNKRPKPIANGRVVEIWKTQSCDHETEATFNLTKMHYKLTRLENEWRIEITAETANGNKKVPIFDGKIEGPCLVQSPEQSPLVVANTLMPDCKPEDNTIVAGSSGTVSISTLGTDDLIQCSFCSGSAPGQVTLNASGVEISKSCFKCDNNSWKMSGSNSANGTIVLDRQSGCVWSKKNDINLTLGKHKDIWLMDEMSVHDGC